MSDNTNTQAVTNENVGAVLQEVQTAFYDIPLRELPVPDRELCGCSPGYSGACLPRYRIAYALQGAGRSGGQARPGQGRHRHRRAAG